MRTGREAAELRRTPCLPALTAPLCTTPISSIPRSPQTSRTHMQTQEARIIISIATSFLIISSLRNVWAFPRPCPFMFSLTSLPYTPFSILHQNTRQGRSNSRTTDQREVSRGRGGFGDHGMARGAGHSWTLGIVGYRGGSNKEEKIGITTSWIKW